MSVPLNGQTATYIVFLHAVENQITTPLEDSTEADNVGNELGHEVSDYAIEYEDGQAVSRSVLRRFAIQQGSIAWGASPFASVPAGQDLCFHSNAEAILLGNVPLKFGFGEGRHVSGRDMRFSGHDTGGEGAWLYALPNPHPDKPLRALNLVPKTQRSIVYGMALTNLTDHPLQTPVRHKLLLTLPDSVTFNALNEVENIDIDLGNVISARRQLIYDHSRWNPDAQDLQPTLADNTIVVEYAAHPAAVLYVQTGTGKVTAYPLKDIAKGPIIGLPPAHRPITIKVVDAKTRQPVGVRIHFHGEAGEYLPPKGHHRKVNISCQDVSAEFANGLNQYAYIRGECILDSPMGVVYVEITRGYEVSPIRDHFTVTADTDEITFELERVLDWHAQGWVTADTHVHFLNPTTAVLEGEAEDVNVVNILATQWGEMFSNVGDFDGCTTHSNSLTGNKGEFVARVGTENRMQVLGHISLLGYSGEMIHPLCTGGATESAIGDPLEVTMADWAKRCADQNGMVVMPHAPHPQCERAADIVLDLVHAFEFMVFNPLQGSISPYAVADWYRFQNLGYHLPLVGGSDKMEAALLLGGIRTYTHLGDHPFSYENWMEATKAGNTFVTLGPLVELKVEGNPPGSKLQLPESGGSLSVEWKVESVRVPIEAVEIIVGGRTYEGANQNGALAASGITTVSIEQSTWVAIRVRGGYLGNEGDIAAHTSAVQIFCGNNPIFCPDDAMEVLKQIEGAMAYVDTIAPRPNADRYRQLRMTLESAYNRMHQRMHQQGVFHEHSPLHDHGYEH